MFFNGFPITIIILGVVWLVDIFLYGADITVELRDNFLSGGEPSDFLVLFLVTAVQCFPIYYGIRIAVMVAKKKQLLYLAVILGAMMAFNHTVHSVWMDEGFLYLYQIRRVNSFLEAEKSSGKFKDIVVAKAVRPGKAKKKVRKCYLLIYGTVKTNDDLKQFEEFADKISLRAVIEIKVGTF